MENETENARSDFVQQYRRSCLQEVREPIHGRVKGAFPSWLRGRLLRNGPGLNEVGPDRYQHAFDGLALLREFSVDNGEVSFQNRFLRSQTYVRNKKANRIVVSEFGTAGHPDPCASVFERLVSTFTSQLTDNALVNVRPVGDEFYAMTETPFLHRIDPATLETLSRVDLRKVIAVHAITAHPHIDPDDGSTYNVGTKMGSRPLFVLVRFPPPGETTPSGLKSIDAPRVVGTIPMQLRLSPSYIHSFALTEHWLVVLEQSLTYNVPRMFLKLLFRNHFSDALQFDTTKKVRFHVMSKTTGELHRTVLEAAPFFTFHHINAFERGGDIVLDVSAYDDDSVLRSLLLAKPGTDKELIFQTAITRRFYLPLKESTTPIFLEPQRLGDGLRGELGSINYERLNGKEYHFAYFVSHLDDVPETTFLAKLDMETGQWTRWERPGWLLSEPIFVARPGGVDEDDGVVLCSLLNPKNENQVSLVALDGQTFEEVGSAEFETPSANPGDFHGCFVSEK